MTEAQVKRMRGVISLYRKKFKKDPQVKYLAKYCGVSEEEITAALVEKPETSAKPAHPLNQYLIQGIMLVISGACIIMSVYFTRLWLTEFLEPVKATLLSSAMILYEVFAFEGGVYLWCTNGKIIATLFFATSIMVICFSILTGLAGQYMLMSDHLDREYTATIDTAKSDRRMELLAAEEQSTLSIIADLQEEMRTANTVLEGIEDQDSREYKTQLWTLRILREDLRKDQERLTSIREQLIAEVDKETTVVDKQERKTFFTWVGIPGIEFILYLFPALFIDIISPLGFYLVLFSKRSETKGWSHRLP